MNEKFISNILFGLICIFLAAGAAVFFVLKFGPGAVPGNRVLVNPENELRVNTLQIRPAKSFELVRTYNGLTKPTQSLDLTFSKAGRIDSISVAPGDYVKEKFVLAELDSGEQLLAPYAGTVVARMISVGSAAGPGLPAFRLVEDGQLEAWVSIPLDLASDVDEGDVFVAVEIGEKEYSLKVSGVMPEVDPNGRTRSIFFSLPDNVAGKHVPGETVRLKINRSEERPGFWLPISALIRETRGLWSIFTVTRDEELGNRVEKHFVEVVHIDNSRAWVNGTIGRETRVVADATNRIVPGQIVDIEELPE